MNTQVKSNDVCITSTSAVLSAASRRGDKGGRH